MSTPYRFIVDRQNLKSTRVGADPDAPAARPLADGEARLRVDQYALTANNITYAAFGEAMHYWQFFDSGVPGFGCVPVWGFAEVIESRCPGVEPGTRLYGYLPMGSHLVVKPERVRDRGFTDGAPHRASLARTYNEYVAVAHDPLYTPGAQAEGLQSLLRPLFTTAFLIADFLEQAAYFGAQRVLLSSASSKTAYATAFCIGLRQAAAGQPARVALTSRGNAGFVQALGCYDSVATYDTLADLDPAVPSVYVDFSGDAALRRALHQHLGDALHYDCAVGGAHWEALNQGRSATPLPGPKPTLFFAPSYGQQRAAEPPQGLGAAELQRQLAAAWHALIARMNTASSSADKPWLVQREIRGTEALSASFDALRDGKVGAQDGLIVLPG